MNNQKINNLLKDPNTNWKYVALVAIVAVFIFGGILAYEGLWPGDQKISLPEIVVPKEETPEIPADWKTYRNEKYSFEIKYPQSWKLEERDIVLVNDVMEIAEIEMDIPLTLMGVTGPFEVKYRIDLSLLPNPENKNLRDLVFSSFGFINEEINFEERKIGDYRVFETRDFPSGDGRLDIFFEISNGLGYIIHLRLHPYSENSPYYENQAKVISVFKQILSTFRFLE